VKKEFLVHQVHPTLQVVVRLSSASVAVSVNVAVAVAVTVTVTDPAER